MLVTPTDPRLDPDVETDEAVLLCEGQCGPETYTPHTFLRTEPMVGTAGKKVMFACDECGHARQWGAIGPDLSRWEHPHAGEHGD